MEIVAAAEQAFQKLQLSRKKRAFIYASLQRLMANGVMLSQALAELYDVMSDKGRKHKRPEAQFLKEAIFRVENGDRFAEALYNWVPYQEASVIEAGEMTGKMHTAIETALLLMKKRAEINKAIFGAFGYPAFLLMAAAFLLYVISSKVIPNMERAMGDAAWTGAAAMLRRMAHLSLDYGGIAAACFAGVVVLTLVILPRWNGNLRAWLDRYPPFSIYRMMYGSTFILTISAMMQAGISMHDAIERLHRRANPWLRERLGDALYGLEMGNNLGVALENAGHGFPDRLAIRFITILSQHTGFEASLARYGEDWLNDSVEIIKSISAVLVGVALCLLAVIIIVTAAGIFGMQENLMNAL
jgi:type II secretory pathway component PulF